MATLRLDTDIHDYTHYDACRTLHDDSTMPVEHFTMPVEHFTNTSRCPSKTLYDAVKHYDDCRTLHDTMLVEHYTMPVEH